MIHAKAKQLLAMLNERFPEAFPTQASQVRPLKIGIDQDLARELPEVSFGLISRVLAHYTHRPVYLKAMLKHRERIDLHGAPAGEVADKAREIVACQYEEIHVAMQAKKATAKAQKQAEKARQQQSNGEPKPKAEKTPQPLPEPPAAAPFPPPKPARRPILSLKGKK